MISFPSSSSQVRWVQQPEVGQAKGRSSILVSHVSVGAQALEPCFADFLGTLAGHWIGSRADGPQKDALHMSVTGSSLTTKHSTNPQVFVFN